MFRLNSQIEEQMQNIRLDEVFRRSVDSLDRWRNSLCQRIERVYQDKLHLIRAKHCQLHVHLQQFQFGQFSQIQALRMDLERNIFIRSTYSKSITVIFLVLILTFRSRNSRNSQWYSTITEEFLRIAM